MEDITATPVSPTLGAKTYSIQIFFAEPDIMLKEVDEEVEEVLRSLLSWLVANLTVIPLAIMKFRQIGQVEKTNTVHREVRPSWNYSPYLK